MPMQLDELGERIGGTRRPRAIEPCRRQRDLQRQRHALRNHVSVASRKMLHEHAGRGCPMA